MCRQQHGCRSGGANCKRKCVPVAVDHGTAQDVRVTGTFCDWSVDGIPLSRGEGNLWRTVLKLAPGRHEYRFLADGVWLDDPACLERIPNGHGGENCVVTVA
jgi:hypothetical protein